MKYLILILLFPFSSFSQEVRTFLADRTADYSVPSGTKEVIIECWGAGGNGNIYEGGSGGDYLLKKILVNTFSIEEHSIGSSGSPNTILKVKVNGNLLDFVAKGGKEKDNNFQNNPLPNNSDFTTSNFDFYYKGENGSLNTISEFSTLTNENNNNFYVRITEIGGDGGNSYYPTSTKGKGSVLLGTITKPQYGNWIIQDNISFNLPTNGITPGGGGGGGSKYFSSSNTLNLFGKGGLGMIRITFNK
ncbi:MAG: hypothetical protein QM535_08140 [Limnohabitans sp.]|nr:hypothetical protein [Limnohabitans sp.]